MIARAWRRGLLLLWAGFLIALGVACVGEGQLGPEVTESVPSAVEEEVAIATSSPLPPETKAILNGFPGGELFNPPRGDVRLVVVSDLNASYGSITYDPEVDQGISLLPFWAPDLVACSGDMVAGQDLSLSEVQIQAMWDGFETHVARRLRDYNLPFGFTVGNHDASSAVGSGGKFLFQKDRDLAFDYWAVPEHDPGVEFVDRFEFPFYYTFKHDDIFFVAWDGSSHQIPEDKLKWVETALASEAAQGAKLRIVLGHLPLYAVAVGRNEPAEVLENAEALQTLLERYDVHTYISGHHHAYYPAHRGNLQLLHMGILGSGPRPLIDSNLAPRKAITVLDINFADPNLTTYTTYDAQTLELIEFEQLPRFLAGHNGMVLRRDVDMDELQATEVDFCRQRLGDALCHA